MNGSPQASDLDAVFCEATAFEILDGPPGTANTTTRRVLVESRSRDDLRALRDALHLGEIGGRCMCAGDATLRVIGADGVRAEIGLHHGTSIRWADRWPFDAQLSSPERFAGLLASLGWTRYRERLDEASNQTTADAVAATRWSAAMPEALRPLAGSLTNEHGLPRADQVDSARAALLATLGSEVAAVRALLRWYGAGAGPWSGFPAYETVAERLLVTFSSTTLVAALDGDLEGQQLTGAARHCAGWHFRKQRRALPTTVVDRLHAHLVDAASPEHVAAFEAAFRRRSRT